MASASVCLASRCAGCVVIVSSLVDRAGRCARAVDCGPDYCRGGRDDPPDTCGDDRVMECEKKKGLSKRPCEFKGVSRTALWCLLGRGALHVDHRLLAQIGEVLADLLRLYYVVEAVLDLFKGRRIHLARVVEHDHVVTELGLDRRLGVLALFERGDCLGEARHHLRKKKPAQVA